MSTPSYNGPVAVTLRVKLPGARVKSTHSTTSFAQVGETCRNTFEHNDKCAFIVNVCAQNELHVMKAPEAIIFTIKAQTDINQSKEIVCPHQTLLRNPNRAWFSDACVLHFMVEVRRSCSGYGQDHPCAAVIQTARKTVDGTSQDGVRDGNAFHWSHASRSGRLCGERRPRQAVIEGVAHSQCRLCRICHVCNGRAD